MRRDAAGNLTLGLWDWFWSNLIHFLLECKDPETSQPYLDAQEDELYSSLSHNLILLLIHRTMQRLLGGKERLLERLVFLIESYVVEDLHFKVKGKAIDVRYRLKSQHLHLMFLLIHY